MDLKFQEPAQGILKTYDWGETKSYKVVCECGGDDHDHNVWVEADDHNVSVLIYTKVKSDWRKNRLVQIWKLLTKGYLEHEVELSLTQQQAFNYAYTLNQAIKDVEEFRKKFKNKG